MRKKWKKFPFVKSITEKSGKCKYFFQKMENYFLFFGKSKFLLAFSSECDRID